MSTVSVVLFLRSKLSLKSKIPGNKGGGETNSKHWVSNQCHNPQYKSEASFLKINDPYGVGHKIIDIITFESVLKEYGEMNWTGLLGS